MLTSRVLPLFAVFDLLFSPMRVHDPSVLQFIESIMSRTQSSFLGRLVKALLPEVKWLHRNGLTIQEHQGL